MIECSRVVDSALRGAPSVLGKSLEPEDPREHDASHNPLVKYKPNHRRTLNRRDIATEHALDVVPRIGLISPVMQRDANQSIADGQIGRVALILRQTVEPLSERQRAPAFAGIHLTSPKPVERP
jgi:hypothetical protein